MRRLSTISFFLILFAGSVFAETFSLWGELKPGPYAVGFVTKFQYDYSRTFIVKYSYDGQLHEGNRARPIQIAIWYPAVQSDHPAHMPYQEYVYLMGQELSFDPLNEAGKKEIIGQYQQQKIREQNASEKGVGDLLASKTASIRDAAPEKGKFPLIVYAPGSSGNSFENSILCEYLASHGYIVAALPSMGAYSRTASIDLIGFYAYMQDIEFVIGAMHDFPNLNPDQLGIIGFSMGGSAATLVQMRNFDVDGVVYLDTGIIFDIVEGWFRPSNYYNKLDLRAAQLYLTRGDAPGVNLNFIDTIPYADTYSVLFKEGFRHSDFISDGMFAGVIPAYTTEPPKGDTKQLYQTVAQYTLQFLDGSVKKKPGAIDYLKKNPEQNGIPKDLLQIERKYAEKAPPREWEFVAMIRAGEIEKAKKIFGECKQKNLPLFHEDPMNLLGYEFLQRQDVDRAISVLALNVEAFPNSANAHDSLSEVYEAAGKKELAIQYAEQGLALLPKDTTLNDQRRDLIKKAIEDRLKRLRP